MDMMRVSSGFVRCCDADPGCDYWRGTGWLAAGPAADLSGIDNVLLERQTREHVPRIRAGILEQTTVDLLKSAEAGDRVGKEGIRIMPCSWLRLSIYGH